MKHSRKARTQENKQKFLKIKKKNESPERGLLPEGDHPLNIENIYITFFFDKKGLDKISHTISCPDTMILRILLNLIISYL